MSSTPSFAPERFHRHVFVWLAPGTRDASAPSEKNDLLHEWLTAGRPLIVRRRTEADAIDLLPLGLALPGKRRISFTLGRETVIESALPPILPLQDGIFRRLDAIAREAGAELRVFGSHAWQFHTGLSYVTPRSDTDLLIFLESRESWERLSGSLLGIPLPPKIDLEIVLRRDASFSWREFAAGGDRILFKGETRAWLGSRSDMPHLL